MSVTLIQDEDGNDLPVNEWAQYGTITVADGVTDATGEALGEFTAGPGVENETNVVIYIQAEDNNVWIE